MVSERTALAYAWCVRVLGYDMQDVALLEEALTHGGSGLKPTYERLEFLGDRILGLAVADMLQEVYPHEDEGGLGRRHAALVQGSTLARIAEGWGLAEHMRVGHKGPTPAGVLADGVEAMLGAIYKDGGWSAALEVVRKVWGPMLATEDGRDAKTMLQEMLQGQKKPVPIYQVVEESGPDHVKTFTVEVTCALGTARGVGPSKNDASKQAAAALLNEMENHHVA
ncbi:MAG: ribonuclease III [Alphaproteobacteria bacterium]